MSGSNLKGESVSEPSDDERLRQLEKRIATLRKERLTPARPHQDEHYSKANVAWRMVIELVAGLGIGFGIGYGLDSLFGTMPLLMVLFILLGFVAGVQTMLRTAKEVQATARKDGAARKEATDGSAGRTGNTD